MKDKRITIYDIAEAAGVSVGTVNRALNNKNRISPKTKRLVVDTAKRLGYRANAAAQGLRRAPITVGAVLFCPIEEYVDAITDGMRSSAEDLEKYNVTVDIRKLAYTSSAECLAETEALLREFSELGYNGAVLFMSSMTNEMGELTELIGELTEKNMLFATVANDIPASKRVIHVGVDAFTAGKMAAEMLELSCKGKRVALLVTSTSSTVNIDYINGFKEYAGESVFSEIRICEHYDDRDKIISATRQLLDDPDLSGIYMATAGSSIACDCIRSSERRGLSVITTDLLKDTPELLRSKIASAAIFQDPYRQGRAVIKLLYGLLTGGNDSGVHLISPHVLLSSNLKNHLRDSGT